MLPGTLKAVKAIGWFIPEYGIAQVSMNLTDLAVTPLHIAFDEVCRRAEARGLRVTGSELVGLVPLSALLDAGRYFLRKQQRSTGVSEAELVRLAAATLGLDALAPFVPEDRIIEYRLRSAGDRPLVRLSMAGFTDETASESAGPGWRIRRRRHRGLRGRPRHDGGQPLRPQARLGRTVGRSSPAGRSVVSGSRMNCSAWWMTTPWPSTASWPPCRSPREPLRN